MIIKLYESYINDHGCRRVEGVTNIEIELDYVPRKEEIIVHEGIEYRVDWVIHDLDKQELIVNATNK